MTSVVNRGWPEAAETTSAIGRRSTSGSPGSTEATAARAEAAKSAGLPDVRMTNCHRCVPATAARGALGERDVDGGRGRLAGAQRPDVADDADDLYRLAAVSRG